MDFSTKLLGQLANFGSTVSLGQPCEFYASGVDAAGLGRAAVLLGPARSTSAEEGGAATASPSPLHRAQRTKIHSTDHSGGSDGSALMNISP